MKFKKQILSEEIGLPKSNRKTYTKNKKQKMVVSEQQLQRLISKITNKSQLNEQPNCPGGKSIHYDPCPGSTGFANPFPCAKVNNQTPHNGMIGWKVGIDEMGFCGTITKISGPGGGLSSSPTPLKRGTSCDNCTKYTGRNKFKGGDRDRYTQDERPRPTALAEQVYGNFYMCTPNGCNSVTITSVSQVQPGMYPTLAACQEVCGPIGTPAPPTGGLADNASLTPANPQTTTTSPVNKRKKCCECGDNAPYSIQSDQSCPKSCPEVPCGTPPTQGPVTTESRILKTTNPITESDIKDMKKWFNRVNKSGRGYNPSVI